MPNPSDELPQIDSPAEAIVCIDRLCGRELAVFCMENILPEAGSLRRMAKELRRGGAVELADLAAKIAKTAPIAKPTFSDRVARRERAKAPSLQKLTVLQESD